MDADKFKDGWSSSTETPCGYGSEMDATVNIRQAIPILVRGLGVKNVVDAGCGDQNWFPRLPAGVSYLGVDLFPRGSSILKLDICEDMPVLRDFIVCRDVLIYFPNKQATMALANFRKCGASYLLATTYKGVYNSSRDVEDGRYAPMDLGSFPFSLGEPLILIPENQPAKFCGLWRL